MRAIVEQWRARPLPEGRSEPWKIAVLVRSRNLLGDVVAELKDETKGAIPFRAVDIEALGERQEVLDLFALTRALLHPADRVAWLACCMRRGAVLVWPICMCSLAADDQDWAERCVEDAVAERGDLLSEESCTRLMRVWPVLQAARQQPRWIEHVHNGWSGRGVRWAGTPI